MVIVTLLVKSVRPSSYLVFYVLDSLQVEGESAEYVKNSPLISPQSLESLLPKVTKGI